jgi:long-chain acyl-CoA synthetase
MVIDCVDVSVMLGRLLCRALRIRYGHAVALDEEEAVREFTVPAVASIDDDSTLADPVWANAERTPDAVQFQRRTGSGWTDVTCAGFRDEVVALARGLIAAGVGVGERVALMSSTRYEWTLIDYAIWAAGGVTVPIYESSSAEQIDWILSDSGAVACFVETRAHRDSVRSTGFDKVWAIEGDGPTVADLVAAGAGTPADAVDERRRARRADDIATLIYTSGTTGRPKGCVLTHRNMDSNVSNALPGLTDYVHPGASTLLFLPLAHSFARLIQLAAVRTPCKLRHTADIKGLPAALKDFRPSFLLAMPRIFEKVFNTAKLRAHADGKGMVFDRAERIAIAYSRAQDRPGGPGLVLRAQHKLFDRLVYSKIRDALGGRCEMSISGGAPLGDRLGHFFRGAGVVLLEGYGLTETSPGVAINLQHNIRVGTVGQPLPGVTVRIADDGEILVRGDNVFREYWKNEAATAEAIDGDGWFHTGDIGELDSDGYLKITGRKKEIIVTAGGKNVAPAVLEDRLQAHPLISQSIVVGDRQPFIAALITIDQEAFTRWLDTAGKPASASVETLRSDADLRAEVRKAVDDANLAVSKAEAIREFRILPREFTEARGEVTPSMKIKRNVVLKEYADEIAAIYGG